MAAAPDERNQISLVMSDELSVMDDLGGDRWGQGQRLLGGGTR